MERIKRFPDSNVEGWPTGSPLVNVLLAGLLSALLFILNFPQSVAATPGDLDPSFGSGGAVLTDFGNESTAFALALQPDGKIVAAGTYLVPLSNAGRSFALARYNPDGSLDATFGSGGKVISAFGNQADANALVVQADGKIVVVGLGNADFGLARYNPDGSLDATFGNGGKTTKTFDCYSGAEAFAAALQTDSKIVAAGECNDDFALARYNPDGSLDPTFGSGGKVTTKLSGSEAVDALALQRDGKIVVAGWTNIGFALARYNPDGRLDATFGSGGKVTTGVGGDRANGLAIQPDGKIVVAGEAPFYYFDYALNRSRTRTKFTLARYNADGSLDATFGQAGQVTTAFDQEAGGEAMALQPDGKIVVVGWSGAPYDRPSDIALARYNADGSLDITFGLGGTLTTTYGDESRGNALALQPDGKIVVAGKSFFVGPSGHSKFVVARYDGGSSTGAPFLRLDLNQRGFVPGETLRAGIVEANYGPPVLVDKYFGALLPAGAGPGLGCPADDAIVFLTTRVVLTCRSASPQSFEPLARNLLLPAGLPPTSTPNFFSSVWPSDVPVGTYVFFIALARAGTTDILALETASASLSADFPAAPSSLTVTAFCRTVTLGWRDNSNDENGFRVERRSEGGSFVEIATLVPGMTSYQDGGLTPGVVYTYRVRAYRGALNSTYSNEAVVTGGPEAPQAPSNLTVAAVSSGNILHWQDNSNNESGFKIVRKVSALFLYTTDWHEIATVGPGVTSYQDRTAPTIVKLTYSYAVRAFSGTCPSGYSNTSSVTR